MIHKLADMQKKLKYHPREASTPRKKGRWVTHGNVDGTNKVKKRWGKKMNCEPCGVLRAIVK